MKLDRYEKLIRTFGEDTVEELTGQSMSDAELASRLGVTRKTLRVWKKKYPNFAEALRIAAGGSDFEVISAIYKRAVGYSVSVPKSYKLKRVEYDPVTGKKLREYEDIEVVEEKEFVPADLRAGEFWLRARQPSGWCDGGQARDEDEPGVVILPEREE